MMLRQTIENVCLSWFSEGYSSVRVLTIYCQYAELSVFRAPYRICSSSGMLSI